MMKEEAVTSDDKSWTGLEYQIGIRTKSRTASSIVSYAALLLHVKMEMLSLPGSSRFLFVPKILYSVDTFCGFFHCKAFQLPLHVFSAERTITFVCHSIFSYYFLAAMALYEFCYKLRWRFLTFLIHKSSSSQSRIIF